MCVWRFRRTAHACMRGQKQNRNRRVVVADLGGSRRELGCRSRRLCFFSLGVDGAFVVVVVPESVVTYLCVRLGCWARSAGNDEGLCETADR